MKQHIKKYFFLLVVFFIIPNIFLAQNDTLYFKHYNVDNGLSHRNVSSIIQDSLGFMWYGTQEGLNKFDGYKFIPFKHDPKNPNSLAHDDISCLAVEKSGIIWIGTKMKGLNRYNPYTGVFEIFQQGNSATNSISDNNITTLSVDTFHHVLWVGTKNGLNAFDPITKKVVTYKFNPGLNTISSNYINCIKVDKKGKIWIGTDGGGLNYLDYKKLKFTAYKNDKLNPKSISSNFIRDVFIDRDFNVWVATSVGLNCFIDSANGFKVFTHDEKNHNSISSNDVTSVYQDKYGKIWVGTAREGLCVYYPKLAKFFLYSHEKDIPNSLNTNKINSISQGRSGMFWAATIDGGLNAFNPKSLKFNLLTPISDDKDVYSEITFVYPLKDNSLLVGTKTQGVFIFDKNTKHIPIDNACCVTKDKLGKTIISSGNKIGELNISSGKLKNIDFKNYLLKQSANDEDADISVLYLGTSGTLWIATKNGIIYAYNETAKTTKYYSCNNPVTCMFEDKQGTVWIGTNGGGLGKLNLKTEKISFYKTDDNNPYPIGGNFISCLLEDSKGTLWIATRWGGLNALLKGSSAFKCYTVHDGLPGNSLNAMLPDNNANIWIGTDNGICRLTFDKDKLLQCRVFDLVDGLPTTEFYDAASCTEKNGRMVFSCRKGLVSFHPDSLKNNPYKPPVIISEFQLFNKTIQPGDSTGILKTSISVTKELFLTYDQNSISFEYTAISFINAGKNKYAYILEGFDKDWNYRNAQNRTASYTNLDPGEYIFKVKASNNDGVWNEKGTSLKIYIAAPFWQKWWFFLLCTVFVSGIFYLVYYIRLRTIIKMQEVRNKISQDLHDNIGSTLSSISIYSEVAKKLVGEKVPESVSVLQGLGESATTAMDNMSDIVWALNTKNDSFTSILERLQIFSGQLFEIKNINGHYKVCDGVDELKLPTQYIKNIYLILKEAVNNVAKYSRAKNCYITITKNEKQLSIEVKDDGIGMAENSKSLGGNGIINMKQRAKELGGSLLVLSKENEGTSISFWFEF